jgi:RNA polymerase sigma factor for flagellar operon FliA
MAERRRAATRATEEPQQGQDRPQGVAGRSLSGPAGGKLADLMAVEATAMDLTARTTEELWELYRAEADRIAEELGLDRSSSSEEEPSAELPLEDQGKDERAEREGGAEDTDGPQDQADQSARSRPGGRSPSLKDLPKTPELEALRNELIGRYYPLVRYIAERLLQTLPKSIELDDLVSAGQFGLMDAIRGFDPERGIKFKTYCSTRVRGSILDQLRSQDWVPRLVRLRASKIERAYQRLTGEFGREPTHAELARELEMDHDQLSAEMEQAQARTMFSLSEKWDDDDDGSVEKVEVLEDREAVDPVMELNRNDLMKYITRSLTHKERFIIEQYYQSGHTMREIGEMLSLTESRVCQIHSNVMGRLKQLLGGGNDNLAS